MGMIRQLEAPLVRGKVVVPGLPVLPPGVERHPVPGKVIALCRIDAAHAEDGTKVEVGQLDGFRKRIPAAVVRSPHFDPAKKRVKGNYA